LEKLLDDFEKGIISKQESLEKLIMLAEQKNSNVDYVAP
jgi:hypothetical protein